jgi:hypothetical protein
MTADRHDDEEGEPVADAVRRDQFADGAVGLAS